MQVTIPFPETPMPRLRAEDFFEAGAFEGERDEQGVYRDYRVELLDGVLYVKAPDGARHIWIVQRLMKWFVLATQHHEVEVLCQGGMRMGTYSAPEPDLAIVPPPATLLERATTALLLVEVANRSLRKDRELKASVYARANIPEYWIVDVNGPTLHRFTNPRRGSYRSIVQHDDGSLEPLALPGVAIDLDALFRDLPGDAPDED